MLEYDMVLILNLEIIIDIVIVFGSNTSPYLFIKLVHRASDRISDFASLWISYAFTRVDTSLQLIFYILLIYNFL